MQVKNLNGTAGKSCKCGSWLNHWELLSGKATVFCCVINCYGPAKHGAHVKTIGLDDKHYIVPTCAGCNGKHGQTLNIASNTALVSANQINCP